MAGNNNSKFLFRNPGIDIKSLPQLPVDLASWLEQLGGGTRGVDSNNTGTNTVSGGGSGDGSGSDFPVDYSHEYGTPYEGGGPGLKALQPQIIAVSKQQVIQDPQGNATVTVTLAIGPEQESMEYELRLTKS